MNYWLNNAQFAYLTGGAHQRVRHEIRPPGQPVPEPWSARAARSAVWQEFGRRAQNRGGPLLRYRLQLSLPGVGRHDSAGDN